MQSPDPAQSPSREWHVPPSTTTTHKKRKQVLQRTTKHQKILPSPSTPLPFSATDLKQNPKNQINDLKKATQVPEEGENEGLCV